MWTEMATFARIICYEAIFPKTRLWHPIGSDDVTPPTKQETNHKSQDLITEKARTMRKAKYPSPL